MIPVQFKTKSYIPVYFKSKSHLHIYKQDHPHLMFCIQKFRISLLLILFFILLHFISERKSVNTQCVRKANNLQCCYCLWQIISSWEIDVHILKVPWRGRICLKDTVSNTGLDQKINSKKLNQVSYLIYFLCCYYLFKSDFNFVFVTK